MQTAPDPLEPFGCPRCGRSVTERYYGPCPSCRDELRVSVVRRPTVEEPPATVPFEPHANVTPNHVATKD